MAKLTIKELDALTAADKGKTLYEDGNIRGEVRSNQSGITVAFSYRYRFNNKTREIRLGVYPHVSITEIRDNRKQAFNLLSEGKDPAIEKQLVKERELQKQLNEQAQIQADENRITVNTLFNRWEKLDLVNRKDAGKEIRRMFEKDVLPLIGNMTVEDVRKAHIINVVDTILARGVNRMAKLILSLMRQMFRFAQDRDIIENDPTSSIRKSKIGGKDTIRDRYLSEAEIRDFTTKLPDARFLKTTECALWIMLSTCCRVSEICKAEWQHLDLKAKTWKIPPENSKNEKAHTIYLSNFAIRQFELLVILKNSDKWIYPNTDNTDHVCEKSITKQVSDRQLADDRKPMSGRSKYCRTLKLADGKWTPHDLRRTGATMMGSLGVRPDVIEKCLNHIEENKMKKTYQHQPLIAEQQEAWRLLGERIEILTSKGTENVVGIKAA